MTCIVAVRDAQGVAIGADSRFTLGNEYVTTVKPKVFQCGDAVIGMAGEALYMNALSFHLIPPTLPTGMPPGEYVCSVLSDAIRTCLVSTGFSKATEDRDSALSLLIGYHGRIYRGTSMGLLYEITRPYNAVGSGMDYALGYLFGVGIDAIPDAVDLVTNALTCAASYDPSVSAPFVVLRADTPAVVVTPPATTTVPVTASSTTPTTAS